MKLDFPKLFAEGRFPSPLIIEGDSRDHVCKEIFLATLGEKAVRGFHPDLIRLEEDFGLEEIRKALYQLRQRPFEATTRVLCIPNLKFHQTQIQNALLKTLEEPSPRWILLLPVQSASQLLETIRSRCLILRTPSKEKGELEDKEFEIFNLITAADELALAEKLEPFFKEREKSKKLFENLIQKASAKQYPGHWIHLAPHLVDAIADLQRNLNQKIVWDKAWTQSRLTEAA